MGLFFCISGVPKGFLQNQKIIRENHKYKRNPKKTKKDFGKTKKTKLLKVSDPPLDMCLFVFVWLSLKFLQNQKNIRENQKYQKKQTHIQGWV